MGTPGIFCHPRFKQKQKSYEQRQQNPKMTFHETLICLYGDPYNGLLYYNLVRPG